MPICNNYKNEIPIFLFFKNMYQNVTVIQILLFQNAVRVIPGKDVPLNVFAHYLETIARKCVCAYKWSSVILGMDASKVSLSVCVCMTSGYIVVTFKLIIFDDNHYIYPITVRFVSYCNPEGLLNKINGP